MPGKPKDPTKTYNPNWGGNHGGGRKANSYRLRLIKIACTEEELRQILEGIKDTRQRATLLLKDAYDEAMRREEEK